MTIPLATQNPYTLEFDAVVSHVNEDGTVEFDATYFYATAGGQPNDTGFVKRNEEEFKVIDVRKRDGHIVHTIEGPGLFEGDKIFCVIDKDRRERHRRMHTGTHVLCAVIERAEGAKVTGNQIGTERTRIDFALEKFDPQMMKTYIDEANRILAQGLPVRKFASTREELLKNPQLVKLAAGFPQDVNEVHMVEIADVDIQPCGGTHVDNTAEIGTLVFDHAESKGKNNRRIYFTLL